MADATFIFTFEGVRKTGDCSRCGRRHANAWEAYTALPDNLAHYRFNDVRAI